MNFHAESLRRIRGVMRFFELSEREVCARNTLTQTEADILAYLGNNPDRDTVSDIVDYRGIPKGYVSKAVDALMSRGYLHREKDEADRRRIHLTPTDAAAPVLGEILRCREEFQRRLFQGFTPEERERYDALSLRIYQNAVEAMKGRSSANHE